LLNNDMNNPITSTADEKRREFRAIVFLTVVLAPIVAVLVVAGFGFCVWIYQMLAGPPAM